MGSDILAGAIGGLIVLVAPLLLAIPVRYYKLFHMEMNGQTTMGDLTRMQVARTLDKSVCRRVKYTLSETWSDLIGRVKIR